MFPRKLFITIILLLFHSVISFADGNEQGYDEVCRIYTEAYSTNMPISTLSQYIFGNIKQRAGYTDAAEAHEAVIHADAKTRYELFKASAEHTLNHKWDCAAMKSVMEMRVK